MTPIYRVKAAKLPHPMDPLHVGNIYSGRERVHRSTMRDRQDLILYMAKLHSVVSSRSRPRGFSPIKLRLTSLREWVYDYRPALDYFFDVKQLGHSVSGHTSDISTLIPKPLDRSVAQKVAQLQLRYEPGPRPDGTISKVFVQQHNRSVILQKLIDSEWAHLQPAVEWILGHEELNFTFKPAGKLRQRDTSVWPVAAVETWPSWLREALFGPGIDIDSAYTQYLMQHLKVLHADSPGLIRTIYPDLTALLEDKVAWRKKLCEQTLGLEWNDDNIDTVKRVCMSLANGSKISPALAASGEQSFSVTAQLIARATSASPDYLRDVGQRLHTISRQYAVARRSVCAGQLKLNPSARNQREVFKNYFEWERVARYSIWKSIDQHGIMVHDGIDGVPQEHLDRLPQIIEQIGIKLTA